MQDWIKRMIFCGLLTLLIGGCAVVGISSGVDVSVRGANYTDDYLSFTVKSISGKKLGIGNDVKKFSDGGTSGGVCCGVIPKPGGVIRIEWKIGENEEFYTKDIIVSGPADVSNSANDFNYLIVRFFPQDEVEAEVIPGDLFRSSNPRLDGLYLGIRQMRHKGE